MIEPMLRVSWARSPLAPSVDLFAGVGAVEVEAVVACLAFDGVAAVAGVPLEAVVAGSEAGLVGADVAVDAVVAFAAVEGVGAVAAAEVVVVVAAFEGEAGERGEAVAGGDRVVAVEAGDDGVLDVGALEEGAGGAGDRDLGSVAEQRDLVGPVAAVVVGGVVALAAVDVEWDRAADPDRHRRGVVAGQGLDDEAVQRGLAARDAGCGTDTVDRRPSIGAREADLVRFERSQGDHGVGRAVAAAHARVEVDVDRRDARRRQVAHGDRVDAAEGAHRDVLDPVHVHRDRTDVAGQPETIGVRATTRSARRRWSR